MAVALAEVGAAVASRKTDEGVRMGAILESLRREQGLTQQELAARLPMSLEGYRNYAKGYGRISRNTLPKWARALNIPAPELAKRLGIELLAEPDASALRQQLGDCPSARPCDGAVCHGRGAARRPARCAPAARLGTADLLQRRRGRVALRPGARRHLPSVAGPDRHHGRRGGGRRCATLRPPLNADRRLLPFRDR